MDVNLDSTIYDDDQYLNDCSSYKRTITIVEKVCIIIASFIYFPIGLVFSNMIPGEMHEFLNLTAFPTTIYYLITWLFLFMFILFTEFHFKNFSLYKGGISSTVNSFIFAVLYVSLGGCFISIFNPQGGSLWLNIALFSALLYAGFLAIVRFIVYLVNRYQLKAILIIGPKDDAEALARRIAEKNEKNTKVRFVFYEIDGEVDDAVYKKFSFANQIILLNTLKASTKEKFLLHFNSSYNKDVFLCSSYFDVIAASPAVKDIVGTLSIEQKPLRIDLVEGAVKRLFDLLCSLILIILTLPVWLLVPLMIKLDSKGPVFYKQERYTKDLKTFKIYKFRSMKIDADPNKPAEKDDNRITRVGKFIRACRIDEIPQVINVIKGDMSFVGPRALMHGDVDERIKENPEYKYRFNVKAGITGLQQVKTNPGCNYEQKLRYDLYYIANYSLVFDIKILFLTIKTVLSKSMSEGVENDELTYQEFLTKTGHEFNQHKGYIRVLNHKRRIDPKTGFIIPLEQIKTHSKKAQRMNKTIKKNKK